MALVRKILEKTLTAGSTSISFTDSDIPNSLLRVYSSQSSLFPISQTLSGNVLTVNYKAQANNVGIALEIVKQGLDIVDNVTSEDTDKALSAYQGKLLKDAIDSIVIPTVPDNITDLDDVSVTSIQDGQVLAWDDTEQKFVNVDQSGGGGGGINYSLTEQNTGLKWVDGKDIYQITIYNAAPSNGVEVQHNIPNISDIVDVKYNIKRYNFWNSDNFMFDNSTRCAVIASTTSYYCAFNPTGSGVYTDLYLTLKYTKTT